MDYKKYLEAEFNGFFDTITDELKFNYVAGERSLVIKELQGQNFKTSRIVPVQLMAYGDDVQLLMGVLRDFAKIHASTKFSEGLVYVKQDYATPTVINMFNELGEVYLSIVMLSGSLLISENISDIKTVVIDGEEIEFDEATITYAASADTQKKVDEPIADTVVRFGSNRLSIAAISKSSGFLQKIRNIRRGLIPTDTSFNVVLEYIDNDYIETYTMKLDGASQASSSANMPIIVCSLVE